MVARIYQGFSTVKGILKPENQDRLVTLTGRSPQGSGLNAEAHGSLDQREEASKAQSSPPMEERPIVFSAGFDGEFGGVVTFPCKKRTGIHLIICGCRPWRMWDIMPGCGKDEEGSR